VHDVASTYHVPILLKEQGLIGHLRTILRLDQINIVSSLAQKGAQTWHAWETLTRSQEHLHQTVSIALVGKYTTLHDSYLSVTKSLEHAAMACSRKLNLVWIDAEHLEEEFQNISPTDFYKANHQLCEAQGILVPGGFGNRGTAGMIRAIKWAREKKVPFLGICLGMQLAVLEYARHVCNIPEADSEEFDQPEKKTPDPMVVFMPEGSKIVKGGTMRLGLRDTLFQPGSEWSKLRHLYEAKTSELPNGTTSPHYLTNGNGASLNNSTANGSLIEKPSSEPPLLKISERHRHRYEVNPKKIDLLTEGGLHFVGKDENGERMEIVELKSHPWFVGVQFHPEYLSRVLSPSKPYLGFVAASAGVLNETILRKGRKMSMSMGDGLMDGMEGVRI